MTTLETGVRSHLMSANKESKPITYAIGQEEICHFSLKISGVSGGCWRRRIFSSGPAGASGASLFDRFSARCCMKLRNAAPGTRFFSPRPGTAAAPFPGKGEPRSGNAFVPAKGLKPDAGGGVSPGNGEESPGTCEENPGTGGGSPFAGDESPGRPFN